MNGEIPSVPITTLAGVTSLTDLLPELPLPTPLSHNTNNKSLLYHHGLPDEAKRLLHTPDPNIVSQVVQALHNTNADNILLNDGLGGDALDVEAPELVRAILSQNPSAFVGRAVAGTRPGSDLPNHNEHPSPHQAGPSPCTPDSPARIPQANSHGVPAGPSGGFQASFLNFATAKNLNQVTSPAQASAAPTPHVLENGNVAKVRDNAVVVMEPIQINAMLHPSTVTNDSSHKPKKHKEQEGSSGYSVVSKPESAGKLTLKLSKPKQSKKKKVPTATLR